MLIKVAIRSFGSPARKSRASHLSVSRLRAAQISAGKLFDRVECFPPDRWCEIESFRPRILVGHGSELGSFAEHVKRCGIEFPSLDQAIFVVTQYPYNPLSEAVRLVLWRTFGVPIYEVYLAPDGTPLCYECEAHEGWHAQVGINMSVQYDELVLHAERRSLHTGLAAEILQNPCACGRPGARVVNVRERLERRRWKHRLAATA
ncbi:MAG TPA: hypothetical protein VHZ07_17360 [Bryobacteraceae bacterium]|jgi:hypothetical protein|nr:hypothetical protein [Bryobacteraceae bacterium]